MIPTDLSRPGMSCRPACQAVLLAGLWLASGATAQAVHDGTATQAAESPGIGASASTPPGGATGAAADAALSLSAAIDRMLAGNRAIQASRLAADAARADVMRANVAPNPTFQAQISNTEARRYPYGQTDRLFRVEQLVERGGKRELRTAAAAAAERAAQMDAADVVRQQRAMVVAAWYDLAAAERLVALSRENVDGYERLRAASRQRLDAGDLAPVDVSRLDIELARAANDLRAAQGELAQAQVALALMLGAEEAAPRLRTTQAFAGRDEILRDVARAGADSAGALEQALSGRADVIAAGQRVSSAQRIRDLAASQRTRDVSVGLQAERAPGFGGTVLGVSATIPLLLNNDFSGDIARAEADLAVARQDAQRIAASVRSDLDRSLAQLRAAADRATRLLGDALPQAARVAQAIEFAFSNGAVGLTDLLDTRRQLAALRADAVRAQADVGRALAAWRSATAREPVEGGAPK